MDKRRFLSTVALGALAVPSLAGSGRGAGAAGPVLLTLSGAIGRANRGPLDPALDQLMHKHDLRFDRAFTFDFAGLVALPSVAIRPTLEYDGKPHRLSGPLLADVLKMAGVPAAGAFRMLLRSLDGYRVELTLSEAVRDGFIVATHLDGVPIPLGGLGPLWAVFEPDRFPEMARKPLPERFARCPWGLYHLEVQAA